MLCAVIHRKTTNKKLELFCLSLCLVSSIFFSVLWYFVQNAEKLEGIEVYDEHYRVDLLNDLTENFCCLKLILAIPIRVKTMDSVSWMTTTISSVSVQFLKPTKKKIVVNQVSNELFSLTISPIHRDSRRRYRALLKDPNRTNGKQQFS